MCMFPFDDQISTFRVQVEINSSIIIVFMLHFVSSQFALVCVPLQQQPLLPASNHMLNGDEMLIPVFVPLLW